MAQRGRKKKRRRSRPPPAAKAAPAENDFVERYRARSEARNEAARAALEPLEPGELPRAVAVGAAVALVLGLVNLAFYVAGGEISGDRPKLPGVLGYSGLMFAAAWGQWRGRYWAVLGMEALLGLLIVVFSLLAIFAENVLAVVVSIGVLVPAGTLFWFLVKAMARIQMPERP